MKGTFLIAFVFMMFSTHVVDSFGLEMLKKTRTTNYKHCEVRKRISFFSPIDDLSKILIYDQFTQDSEVDCNYPNGICHHHECYCKGEYKGDRCETYVSWYGDYEPSAESLGFLLASTMSSFAIVTTAFFVYTRGYCICKGKEEASSKKEIRFNMKDSLLNDSDDEDD